MIFDDPQFQAIFEDASTFTLDGVAFTIRCKVNSFGATYYPDATKDGQVAQARMLPWRNTFNDLVFVNPPAWLVNAINPEYSMYTEAKKKTRREPAQPAELYIPLWETPSIQRPLQRWAKEHPFIGCQREVLRSYKSRRGIIEVCKYQRHDTHHLEVIAFQAATKTYQEPERIAGDRDSLERLAESYAHVAGAREVRRRTKQPRKIIPFPE